MAEEKKKDESDKKTTPKNEPLEGLIKTLDELFVKNSPVQLPDNAKEWVVKFGPWVLLLFVVLSIPGLISLLSLLGFFSSSLLNYSVGSTGLLWVGVTANIVALIITGAAIPGLLERKMAAWRLLFYSQLLNIAAYALTTVSVTAWLNRSIFSILGMVVGMYILFQIKDKYKG